MHWLCLCLLLFSGYYIFIETASPRRNGDRAKLGSFLIDASGRLNVCQVSWIIWLIPTFDLIVSWILWLCREIWNSVHACCWIAYFYALLMSKCAYKELLLSVFYLLCNLDMKMLIWSERETYTVAVRSWTLSHLICLLFLQMRFYYHMRGDNTRELNVYTRTQINGPLKLEWSLAGELDSWWQRAQVDLDVADPFQVCMLLSFTCDL